MPAQQMATQEGLAQYPQVLKLLLLLHVQVVVVVAIQVVVVEVLYQVFQL
jgi:hypothetical protein